MSFFFLNMLSSFLKRLKSLAGIFWAEEDVAVRIACSGGGAIGDEGVEFADTNFSSSVLLLLTGVAEDAVAYSESAESNSVSTSVVGIVRSSAVTAKILLR